MKCIENFPKPVQKVHPLSSALKIVWKVSDKRLRRQVNEAAIDWWLAKLGATFLSEFTWRDSTRNFHHSSPCLELEKLNAWKFKKKRKVRHASEFPVSYFLARTPPGLKFKLSCEHPSTATTISLTTIKLDSIIIVSRPIDRWSIKVVWCL